MNAPEDLSSAFESLKICPVTDIHKYFGKISDSYRYLPKTEKYELANSFYSWAKENATLNPVKFSYAEFFLGLSYHLGDEHEKAFHLINTAREHFEMQQNPEGIGLCAVLAGSVYRTLGNFELALKSSLEGFNLLKGVGHYWTFLSGCTNTIANIYLEMNHDDEARAMFALTYEQCEKADDYYFMIYALHGLGKVNMRSKNDKEARKNFEEALNLAFKIDRPLAISNSQTELANFYFQTGQYDEAEQLHRKAFVLREENHLMGGVVTSCISLAAIFIKQKRWDEATSILNKGLTIAEEIRVKPKISQVHFLLSEIYRSNNDPEKCLNHFKVFHEIREQVDREDSVRKLEDAKLIFEAEQNKKENLIIKKQKEEIEKQNAELQRTVDELTLTKISRKARTLTLVVAVILFIVQDFILGFALEHLPGKNYFLSLIVKMGIIFSLSPINKAIERNLLRKMVQRKKEQSEFKEVLGT